MTRAVLAVSRLSCLVLGSDQQEPVFRASTDTVSIWATVRGQDGRLLTDLTRGDFEILENGRPAVIS